MSAQWNSNYSNCYSGNEHPRPYVTSPMVLACRICEKVFLNSHSLIEHYESHQDEFVQGHQNNQTIPISLITTLRERRQRNFTNIPFQPSLSPPFNLQQRYHPYFPNGFRSLLHGRSPMAQSQPFLASTQTQNFLQPRYPVVNQSTLGVSLPFPNSISGRTGAGCSQFVIRQRQSAKRVSPPQRAPIPDTRGKNRDDQLTDKETVWYLGQLEKPIPKMIDQGLSYG